ncbi:hypothetical protein B0T40_20800 [Chromobacterium haemolyticum]|uniref:Uncharacterized protein n=1 Tax=Chromobacterium rhizoryzae TaxID=1778675 RepID=A0AAD0RWW4_9NEIS|nr:hypothetical protein D1345_23175 [Chromobacterium rhizoryzae]OQS31969.1 hypothetical protein B0T40_20800 [Chromobacterium haemolyticum]
MADRGSVQGRGAAPPAALTCLCIQALRSQQTALEKDEYLKLPLRRGQNHAMPLIFMNPNILLISVKIEIIESINSF